jgi:hypothetical protein
MHLQLKFSRNFHFMVKLAQRRFWERQDDHKMPSHLEYIELYIFVKDRTETNRTILEIPTRLVLTERRPMHAPERHSDLEGYLHGHHTSIYPTITRKRT